MSRLLRFAISTGIFFALYLTIELLMFERPGGIAQSLTRTAIASGVYFLFLFLIDAMFARRARKKPKSHRTSKHRED